MRWGKRRAGDGGAERVKPSGRLECWNGICAEATVNWTQSGTCGGCAEGSDDQQGPAAGCECASSALWRCKVAVSSDSTTASFWCCTGEDFRGSTNPDTLDGFDL